MSELTDNIRRTAERGIEMARKMDHIGYGYIDTFQHIIDECGRTEAEFGVGPDGPDAEDGPWAHGWEERCNTPEASAARIAYLELEAALRSSALTKAVDALVPFAQGEFSVASHTNMNLPESIIYQRNADKLTLGDFRAAQAIVRKLRP